jgi:hypothetical protein
MMIALLRARIAVMMIALLRARAFVLIIATTSTSTFTFIPADIIAVCRCQTPSTIAEAGISQGLLFLKAGTDFVVNATKKPMKETFAVGMTGKQHERDENLRNQHHGAVLDDCMR